MTLRNRRSRFVKNPARALYFRQEAVHRRTWRIYAVNSTYGKFGIPCKAL